MGSTDTVSGTTRRSAALLALAALASAMPVAAQDTPAQGAASGRLDARERSYSPLSNWRESAVGEAAGSVSFQPAPASTDEAWRFAADDGLGPAPPPNTSQTPASAAPPVTPRDRESAARYTPPHPATAAVALGGALAVGLQFFLRRRLTRESRLAV